MVTRRAKYEGECIRCGKLVKKGTMAFMHQDSWGGWMLIHLKCDASKDVEKRPQEAVRRDRTWIDVWKYPLPWKTRPEASQGPSHA